MSETLDRVSASNVQLRTEAADAKSKLEDAAELTHKLEHIEAELRTAHQQMSFEVEAKGAEAVALADANAVMQAEVVVANQSREVAEQATLVAKDAAVAASESEA